MLRSAKDIIGYSLLAVDGQIGEVEDLLVDDQDLSLRYLVVDTGRWLPGKKILLGRTWISSVSRDKQSVVVNIEKQRIKDAPEYLGDAELDRAYETKLHDYYNYPYYWM
jgi:hypothetical protein